MFRKLRKRNQRQELEESRVQGAPLVTFTQPSSIVSEQLRNIRTNIKFAQVDSRAKGTSEAKSLMVTSPDMGGGKSTISSNLAYLLTGNDQDVLLVDADLRKPLVHRTFGLSNKQGLSNLISEEDMNPDPFIRYIPSLNLHVLTSGIIPPNPEELLASERMAELMAYFEEKFSYVVYDVPPVLPVTDAQVLASRVDGIIMLAREGLTEKPNFQQAKKLLEIANGNILGAVLNQVASEEDNSYYGDYYYRRGEEA